MKAVDAAKALSLNLLTESVQVLILQAAGSGFQHHMCNPLNPSAY